MRPARPSLILRGINADALLVSNLTNIRYLTGMELSFGFALIKPKSITLYVDDRYREAATKGARKGIVVEGITALSSALAKVSRCGIEAEEVTVAQLTRLKRKNKNTKFVQTMGIIEGFRRSKDPEELRYFRRAQRITKKIITSIPSTLRVGISEQEVAEYIRSEAIKQGADGLSFDSIVAFGSHSSRPHHHPTSRKLKGRDIIQIDCGVRMQGYCADQSAVFFMGEPTKEQKRVYEAVERAKRRVIREIRVIREKGDQVTNHQLDAIARSSLAEDQLEEFFTHSLGHGVGLDIHEGPSLSQKAPKVTLQKGEIVTIEPGVYLPGEFGIRLEEEIVV